MSNARERKAVHPWLNVLRVIRAVVERCAPYGVLSLTAFCKVPGPGNFYFVLFPVAEIFPRLHDIGALEDREGWAAVDHFTFEEQRSHVLTNEYDAWYISQWCRPELELVPVVVPEEPDNIEAAVERWCSAIDLEWLESLGKHPDIEASLILEWLERLIEIVEHDHTATLHNRPGPLKNAMVVEVDGENTTAAAVWWPGYDHLSICYSC